MRRLLRSRWLFTLALTPALVGLIFWRVDVSEVAEPLREANYSWAVAALLVSILAKAIDTIRWQVYLAKVGRIPLVSLFGAYLIGGLGNNLVPGRAGDIAKIQILANRYGVSRVGLAATVFVAEGVLTGVTFLVFLFIGLALLDVGFLPPPLLWSLAVVSGGGAAVTVVVSHFFPRDIAGRRWLRPLPQRLRDSLSELWPRFLDGLETMRNYGLLAKAIALNFASWSVQAVMFWMFGLAFGLDLSFGAYMVIMIAAYMVVTFPLTPWNIGTWEVVLLEILAAWGVARHDALAYTVATHMLINLWVVAIGLVAIWLMQISPREVFALGRRQEAEAPLPKKASLLGR